MTRVEDDDGDDTDFRDRPADDEEDDDTDDELHPDEVREDALAFSTPAGTVTGIAEPMRLEGLVRPGILFSTIVIAFQRGVWCSYS